MTNPRPITDAELKELVRLEAAATHGEWSDFYEIGEKAWELFEGLK